MSRNVRLSLVEGLGRGRILNTNMIHLNEKMLRKLDFSEHFFSLG